MEDNNINMNFITLTKEDNKFIKCFYGNDQTKIDVSEILQDIINFHIKKKKYFITVNVNNTTFKRDPILNKKKVLYLEIKNTSYQFEEESVIYFNIKFSFNLILKHNFNNLNFNKYNYATIFGKGPTFKNVNKKDKELRCAINQAANIAQDVDFLCMNDFHNIFKIDLKTYKNLKYLLIPEYMHINQKSRKEGYFVNVFEYLNKKFTGNLIIYDLMTSKKKTEYILNLDTAQSSGNNCFEFIGKYANIKLIDLYGVGIDNKRKYNKLFVGNGVYDETVIKKMKSLLKKNADTYKLTYNLN